MPSLLRNVAALIAALTILQLAGGLLGARLPLSFTVEGHTRTEWGIVAAAYSAGFMMGAMLATTLLARIGNIRVYAACAAIFAVATLALHFTGDLWSWGLARMIAGIAVALMFAAIESWLGNRGPVYEEFARNALACARYMSTGRPPEPVTTEMLAEWEAEARDARFEVDRSGSRERLATAIVNLATR